jgi:hypothetical protein
VSEKTIRNIWHQQGLPSIALRASNSQEIRTLLRSYAMSWLYLNPPDQAVVLWVDKSGVQGVDMTRPVLPLVPELPVRQTRITSAICTTCCGHFSLRA